MNIERLTERNDNGTVGIGEPLRPYNYDDIKEALEKLAAYKDTGLDPQEVERIADAYRQGVTMQTESAVKLKIVREIQVDRLRELAAAEKRGLVKIIPQYKGHRCGGCAHFKRCPGRGTGTCEVKPYAVDRYGNKTGFEFRPAQSRVACKAFEPAEEN